MINIFVTGNESENEKDDDRGGIFCNNDYETCIEIPKLDNTTLCLLEKPPIDKKVKVSFIIPGTNSNPECLNKDFINIILLCFYLWVIYSYQAPVADLPAGWEEAWV